MIGHGIMDRRLVTVVAGEMPSIFQIIRQIFQDLVTGDRTKNEGYSRIINNVGNVRREKVINNDDLFGILFKQ